MNSSGMLVITFSICFIVIKAFGNVTLKNWTINNSWYVYKIQLQGGKNVTGSELAIRSRFVLGSHNTVAKFSVQPYTYM